MKRTLFILFFIVLAFGFSTNASASISDGNRWGGCQSVVSKAMSFLSDKLGVKLAYAQVCFPPPVSVCTLNSAYNFWPMNEASNSFVDNVSGANDGTAVGTTIVPGKFGNARNFNGTSDYVNVGDIYTTGSAGTVSIWIKPSGNYSGTQMPFMGYTYPFVVGLGTAFNTTWCPGRWMLYLPNTPGLGNYGRVCSDLAYNDTNFPTNVWTHLAITYDGTWVRFYKNGAPVGSPVAQPAAGNSNNATFSIGRQGNYGEYFSGGIDEVGLWRLVLTPAQIFNLYNSGSSGLITNETTFSWPTYSFPSSSACGSYYRLTVTGSGGGTFAGLTNTSYHIDLYPSTSYTWTVDAMDYDPVSGCDYHTTPASPPPPFTTLACAPTTVDIKAEDLTDSIFKDGPVTIPSGASTTLQLTSTNADSLTASGDWSGPKLVTDGPASAAGGAITTSGGDTIHAFVTSGTFTPNGNGTVEVLVVAGGGGGGSAYAGGGGAGGLVHSSTYAVTSGVAIPVAVGGGGAQNNNGGNSVFGSITAVGGGSGGTGAGYAGNNGGSGGGGSGNGTGGGAPGGGWGIQGGRGGAGLNSGTCPGGGGGGGAGAVGTDSGANGGNGGNGRQYSISGSAVYYAGGGGGRSLCGTNGSGGFGGGGNYGVAGTVNTGGGGGGTVSGGSGIVIVRYRGPYDTDPLISSKTYTITSTNSYSSAVDSVTVNVSAPLTLSVSCLASPVTASVGQQVTWTASVSGGTGAYSYLWGGDAPLAGHAGNPVVVTYPTVGVKTGSVIVTSGSETVGPIACASSVNVLDAVAPTAVPGISTDGLNYSDSITVTRGVATKIYLSVYNSTAVNGVSSGGKCEWNAKLQQGPNPTFEKVINNPASLPACNLNNFAVDQYDGNPDGRLTFNDVAGLYSYKVLKITDNLGLTSPAGSVSIKVVDPPLLASCSANPLVASQYFTPVTWSTVRSGGNGTYSYLWDGSAPLAGHTEQNPVVNYPTIGVKSGRVRVVSGGQTRIANCGSVTVSPSGPPVIVVLLATPSIVPVGATTLVTWQAINTWADVPPATPGYTNTPCVASSNPVGIWSGIKTASGNERSNPISQTSVLTLSCDGPGGTASKNTTVLTGIIEEPHP